MICKCYVMNDYDFYPAVILGIASEWTVTEDCPIHSKKAVIEKIEREKHLSDVAFVNQKAHKNSA